MSEPIKLGDVLRGFRRRAELTQRQAADRAGLSVAALRDLEQGRVRTPRTRTLRALGRALRLSSTDVAQLADLARSRWAGDDDHGGTPVDRPPAGTWVGVLGPLSVRVDGGDVDLGSESQRMLLGVLALSPNTPVSVDELGDLVRRAGPVTAAIESLPNRISRLRRQLRPQDPAAEAVELTVTGGRYRLSVTENRLDLLGFRRMVTRARQARREGATELASQLYATAMAQWRGGPLAGLAALADHPAVVALERERHRVVVEYAAVAAELDRHDDVLPFLHQVVEADPLHQPAQAALMVALAGTGQPAAALGRYERLRRRLAAEVGTASPGRELQEAHRRVLRQQVLRPPQRSVTARRQLPADFVGFHGRQAELERVEAMLRQRADGDPAVCVVSGIPGVGKTRFAVHLGHRLAAQGRHPDQLYADLRGHTGGLAAGPAEVLASFLRLLGVPGDQIPSDLAGRQEQLWSRFVDRPALVLLDDAADAGQVQPLLPSMPRSVTLVTSRHPLPLARARTLRLPVFTECEATELLVETVGAHRISAEPDATTRLIDACGRLPLALALVAHRLQARPAWQVADLAARLAEPRQAVATLAGGRGRTRDALATGLPVATRQRAGGRAVAGRFSTRGMPRMV